MERNKCSVVAWSGVVCEHLDSHPKTLWGGIARHRRSLHRSSPQSNQPAIRIASPSPSHSLRSLTCPEDDAALVAPMSSARLWAFRHASSVANLVARQRPFQDTPPKKVRTSNTRPAATEYPNQHPRPWPWPQARRVQAPARTAGQATRVCSAPISCPRQTPHVPLPRPGPPRPLSPAPPAGASVVHPHSHPRPARRLRRPRRPSGETTRRSVNGGATAQTRCCAT